ncbi:alpha/beta fold hydrolase [Clostridium sp.]|uniref:alpha/beta fold hydrolase n=1 Tax=Clostridium sp. TaxID=1506 RepID=UPI002FDCAC62
MKKNFKLTLITLLILCFTIIPCKAASNIKQKYITYKKVKIYTEVYNYSPEKKEAIIFLHGMGGNHSHGEFLYNENNPYMTITLDYLDHGKSSHIPLVSWKTQLNSIKKVLDCYGIKKVHLVGHSFGADTAMMFAKKYPDRVKDIVLLDRAYYNFKDLEQFNMTKNLNSVLEYDPQSDLSKEEEMQYINLCWDNDITKTWNINKNVLLIAADTKNFTGDSSTDTPSLAGIISMIKENPEEFGVDPSDAGLLPDMTKDDVLNIVNLLNTKSNNFAHVNNKFSVVHTSYTHGEMVRDKNAMTEMRSYIINYLENKNTTVK